jgi:hypothetical protein
MLGVVIAAFAALTADIIQEFGEWIVNKAYTKKCKESCMALCDAGSAIAGAGLTAGFAIASAGCAPLFFPYPSIGAACLSLLHVQMGLAFSNIGKMYSSCKTHCDTLPSTKSPDCCKEE